MRINEIKESDVRRIVIHNSLCPDTHREICDICNKTLLIFAFALLKKFGKIFGQKH